MIRNVVFDMGQVLIRWSAGHFLDLMGVTGEDREALDREIFHEVEWIQLDHGLITESQAIEGICSRLPQRLHPYVERMVSHWWEWPLEPVDGMARLAEELKEAGCGVYLLSNASVRLRQYFPQIPASRFFDGLLVSGEERLLKPQREIFQALCATYRLKPEECFFIDDSNANVEGALAYGMSGAVFHGDLARLRRQLRAAGVAVSAE